MFISHPTFDRDAELRDQRENGSHRIGLKLYKKGFKCHYQTLCTPHYYYYQNMYTKEKWNRVYFYFLVKMCCLKLPADSCCIDKSEG